MDPDRPLDAGWRLLTEDGLWVTEREFAWPDLPPELRVRELVYVTGSGRQSSLGGFDAYGFQRYALAFPGSGRPAIEHAGTQLMAVSGGDAVVTVLDIREPGGETSRSEAPLDAVTYDRRLFRIGVGSEIVFDS